MAISTLEYDTVNNACATCQALLADLEPKLSQLQQIFDSEGGVKSTLTQEDLDGVAAFSGLTVAQVTDGLYVLTALLLPSIQEGTPALTQLAARYRGFAAPPPMTLAPAAGMVTP